MTAPFLVYLTFSGIVICMVIALSINATFLGSLPISSLSKGTCMHLVWSVLAGLNHGVRGCDDLWEQFVSYFICLCILLSACGIEFGLQTTCVAYMFDIWITYRAWDITVAFLSVICHLLFCAGWPSWQFTSQTKSLEGSFGSSKLAGLLVYYAEVFCLSFPVVL